MLGRISSILKHIAKAIKRSVKSLTIWTKSKASKMKIHGQAFEFTCGPACLNIALTKKFGKQADTLESELEIWREANTVFMGNGHPGCSGEGLALSAKKRKMDVVLYRSEKPFQFSSILRDKLKKRTVEQLTKKFEIELRENRIKLIDGNFDITIFNDMLSKNFCALVLANMKYRNLGNAAHWVMIEKYKNQKYRIIDPYGKIEADGQATFYLIKQIDLESIFYKKHKFCIIFLK